MKILLIRVSSLGDVLHNMPIVADLLRQFPHAQIDWVVEEAYVNLVRLNPHVQQVFPFALRRWRKSLFKKETRQEIGLFFKTLRAQEYDLILETQGLTKTGIIMGLVKTTAQGKKIGLANGTEGSGYEAISRIFHDHSVAVDDHTHAVQRGRLVAAFAGGYKVDTPAQFGIRRLDIHPSCIPDQDYIVFFHGTAGAEKKWARENWIALAQHLQAYPILLPWGNPAEKAEAEQMAAAMPNARVLPALSMQEAISLAQRARCAIGVDTGLTHIAAAFETPTIEIYCATPRWKTEGNWSNKILNFGDQGRSASIDEVRQGVDQLLAINAN